MLFVGRVNPSARTCGKPRRENHRRSPLLLRKEGRYLVEPRRAGSVKSRLIKVMLERLNAEPEKVMFPKADLR